MRTGFEIDDLSIDLASRRVLRAGVEVQLSRHSFELLVALAGEAPDPVGNEVLIERVWRGEARAETLEEHMSLLRQSLGDASGQPRYIERVPGAGYRLIAAIRRSGSGLRWRMRLIGAVVGFLALILVALVVGAVKWIAAGPPG